jgi:hypothetical protein
MAATQSPSTEVGIKPACDAFGIARSGFYRGQSARFVDTAPATVYATLLDEGRDHCSIRTLYRILDEQAESRSAGTSSVTRSIRSRNSWRPPPIKCGPGTSRNFWAP